MLAPPESIHNQSADSSDVYALPPWYHSFFGACQLVLKRLIDIIGAAVGLVALAPIFGVIALLVVLDSGWPIFFRWNVVGRRGRYFTGYKFRTMVQNAEVLQVQFANQNEMTGPVFKMRHDPRVTRVGRILRKYSLDELPQLWSVFKGDMSLVGPRPLRWHEFEVLTLGERARFAVTPGITCLWQISGRSEIQSFEEWVRLDLEYIRTWSLWLDLRILIATFAVVVRGRGAY
jgi:lipopolysaccharide/colanic/teichoic acid biosynthesis glycosyltransferase